MENHNSPAKEPADAPAGEPEFVGFWRRFVAFIIDSIWAMIVVGLPLAVVLGQPDLDMDSVVRDPDSKVDTQQPEYAANAYRSIKPEFLVLVGLCTHLGCSPKYVQFRSVQAAAYNLGDEWKGGFFCPCHGSKFDLAGRVYQSVPAPTNLEVPPHRYIGDAGARIQIGLHHGAEGAA